MNRSSGILLHPTSLPGPHGIGDLGDSAYRFIDFLAAAGQHLWQVLPLGPTSLGNSPYTSFSAFAGNPLLISPDRLVACGHLTIEDVQETPVFPADRVRYGEVIDWKNKLLERAFTQFSQTASAADRVSFAVFCETSQYWLEDYVLFMALHEAHGMRPWPTWPQDIAKRHPDAINWWRNHLTHRLSFHRYIQFVFSNQWSAVKGYASERQIAIMGDIPIFVAHHSADVWANPALFYLNETGYPSVVAGVPPDYFSKTGQLWGNPLYRWDEMANRGYSWWIERFRAAFSLVDYVRVDHFRGFEAYWEIPAHHKTAVRGHWVPGPGTRFFEAVRAAFGEVPIIAEDLGLITPEVHRLREACGFPGMKVLQFAFGSDAANTHLPHNHSSHAVVYTGTHDNDTTLGWFSDPRLKKERTAALRYMGVSANEMPWPFIRLALASVADTAILPLQDVLGLGSDARMNIPGLPSDNWAWRYTDGQLADAPVKRLRELTEIYGRLSEAATETLTGGEV